MEELSIKRQEITIKGLFFYTTPHKYLQSHKLRYAKKLLQNTDLSMMEIASKIGYSNLSHFANNFKKYYGITPNDCRKGF